MHDGAQPARPTDALGFKRSLRHVCVEAGGKGKVAGGLEGVPAPGAPGAFGRQNHSDVCYGGILGRGCRLAKTTGSSPVE